jgi:hypothetical protein
MLVYQAQLQVQQSREAKKAHNSTLKEVLLAIVTCGLSLLLSMNAVHKDE